MDLGDGDYLPKNKQVSKNDLDLRLFWTFCNKVISFWWQGSINRVARDGH